MKPKRVLCGKFSVNLLWIPKSHAKMKNCQHIDRLIFNYYGISIGHNDTDNVMRNNWIEGSGRVGILFRNDARGADFWANRNVLEGNTILNSGDEKGIAIDIQGNTKDLTLRNNQVRETRAPMQRIGLRISEKSERITLADNTYAGVATQVLDLRQT